MYGQGKVSPKFTQGVHMYMPSAQQDHPPSQSPSFQTSTITSQAYMVHQGYSSLTTHLGQPDSTIYEHLSAYPVPPSGRPNSGHSYSILPPQLHLNGNAELMQSFQSAQRDPQQTQNVYQTPSHVPQSSALLPGQASFRGQIWPPFSAGVRDVQPTLQPHPPLSSSMLYAYALGPVAYTAPQLIHKSPALVPSLPSLPPRVAPPLPPSSQLGGPHACVMNHSILLPSQINQFSYYPNSRPSLLDSMRNTGVSLSKTDSDIDMEDNMPRINEEQVIPEKLNEPQLQDHPTPDLVFVDLDEPSDNSPLVSSYRSNSVDGEQSVHVLMHSDDRNSAAPDVEVIEIKAAERNKNRRFKSLKNFKAALVKFVKKVLDPFWRQCNMTRVIFKTIVHKSVDKVLSSLKPHHIPNSDAKINRYIGLSRSKLTSLVMGYVHKYVRV